MARCPVCEARIAEPVPPYCDRCGWDLANDITLVTSVHEIPEKVRSDYLARVKIARANWSRQIELERKLREQEASGRQRIGELERRLEEQAASQRQPEQPRQKEADLDEEICRYTRLVESDPSNAAAYCNRGIAYHRKGQYDRAIEDYTRAISLEPNAAAAAYHNRRVAYRARGEESKAERDFEKSEYLKSGMRE